MKKIYVMSKTTGKVFERVKTFNGTISAKEDKTRVVVSAVKEYNGNLYSTTNWIKSDLIKITKEDNPECFL